MSIALETRRRQWDSVADRVFDVAIIGCGINGACIYHHLRRAGLSVLIVDRGDFAGATSQASAMMVWGGLLYLKNGHLFTVRALCRAREDLVADMADWVKPCRFRYVTNELNRKRGPCVRAGLELYWLMGDRMRERPHFDNEFPARALFREDRCDGSLVYEEACVVPSDARFVLQWLLPFTPGPCQAMNHCGVEHCGFDRGAGEWRIDLDDKLVGKSASVRARWVVNAAGVWTDALNKQFGLRSPYRHILSKGVFLGLPRLPGHEDTLIFDTVEHGGAMSLSPWGPVSLWGPTETLVDDPDEGFVVEAEDVDLLLGEINAHLREPMSVADVVSIRGGVRPLAVAEGSTSNGDSLALSRRHHVHFDGDKQWISVYGGKLTSCVPLATRVARMLKPRITATHDGLDHRGADCEPVELDDFPGITERVPSASWCAQHEMCSSLDDYLRRRTNISQWVPRCGLGRNDEHLAELHRIAMDISGDETVARRMVEAYREKVAIMLDRLLTASGCAT